MKKKVQESEEIVIEVPEVEPVGPINTLEDLPGVGPTTAERLRESGFDNLMSIAVMPTTQLVEVTGMTDAAAAKLISCARAALDMNL